MRIAILLLTALLLPAICFSQKKDKRYFLIDSITYDSLSPNDKAVIDSILPLYHKAATDTARLSYLDYLSSNLGEANLWRQYSQIAYEKTKGMLRDSASMNLTMLRLVKNYYGTCLQNIGYYKSLQGDKAAALDYDEQSLKIFGETNNKAGMSGTFNNMAIIFNQDGNIPKAM